MICAVCMELPGHQREVAITVVDGKALCRNHLEPAPQQDWPGPPPPRSGWPDPQDFILELREAVGMFAGAMSIPPKQAWEEAIERVRELAGSKEH